jgi:hypothetical protein
MFFEEVKRSAASHDEKKHRQRSGPNAQMTRAPD